MIVAFNVSLISFLLSSTGSEYDFDDDDSMDTYGGGLDDSDSKSLLTAEQQWINQLILKYVFDADCSSSVPLIAHEPCIFPVRFCYMFHSLN